MAIFLKHSQLFDQFQLEHFVKAQSYKKKARVIALTGPEVINHF